MVIMASGKERGVSRIQEKLNSSISSEKYYEAHQLYKTLYFRLLAQNKFTELLDLLENGARMLLEKDQMESGADLAISLLDVLVKSKHPVTDEWIFKVTKLFSLMNTAMPERDAFVTDATKWSMGNQSCGHPLFHGQIAKIYWSQKNTKIARKHFLRSSDGVSFSSMLIELHTSKGYKSEVDIFIVQAVLHLLSLKRTDLALDTFKHYTTNHPDIKKSELPYPLPLLNFTAFIFDAINVKRVELFKELLLKYNKHIVARDPSFADYLDKIGNIYFDIPLKPKLQGNGFVENILSSILGMDMVDSSSDEEFSSAKSQQGQSSQGK